ncbi:MAG TPA: DUF1028 domain-containing protein [Micromonosporaceae bacterium]
MTFSIVARSGDAFGVAVASKFLAVGSAVPAAEAGVGALATQAFANLGYRQAGLALLGSGASAADTLAQLLAGDPGRETRQVGVVGASGDGATFTGGECDSWAGGLAGDGYAIQGNILAGPQVVERMREAWLASDPASPLSRRLYAALLAGDEAGGDRRGRQSAALLVARKGGGYGGTSDIEVDLRVDDHPAPTVELGRLLDLHELYFTKPDPAALLDLSGQLGAEVRERLARLGYHAVAGDPDALDAALFAWAGVENLEERLVARRIDPVVLRMLREAS